MVYQKIQKFRKKINPAMQTASKALSIASRVAKAINVEKKYSDKIITMAVNDSPSGTVTLLNGVANGDTSTTRDGNQMKMTSLFLRGTVVANGDYFAQTSRNPQQVRIAIVWDKQADGALPATNEIFEVIGAGQVNSPLKITNGKRFKVLYDKALILGADGYHVTDAAVSTFMPQARHFEHYISFTKNRQNGLKVRYSGDTSAVSDIATGCLYLVVLPGDGYGAYQPQGNLYSRIRYVDN